MKISQKVEKKINDQINHEFYSAYLYLAMSAYFERNNLKGFAHWMRKQAEEEKEHAMKYFNYVFERQGNVVLEAIEKPKKEWKNPLEVFEEAFKHEQKVTSLIYEINNVAEEEKDYATISFNKWFVDEQVEEEATALEIVEKLKLIGDNKQGLFMMDSILGKRE
ncbi:MAG: ferritin [Candidatus Woesearchaeota archaeon]